MKRRLGRISRDLPVGSKVEDKGLYLERFQLSPLCWMRKFINTKPSTTIIQNMGNKGHVDGFAFFYMLLN